MLHYLVQAGGPQPYWLLTCPVLSIFITSHFRQVRLTDCVVTFVAHDLQALSVVEGDAFQDLLYTAEPKFQMPSRKHLSYKLLPQHAECVREMLKQRMLLAPSVYLTVDMWSSRDMRSYIGITSHFVVDFVLGSDGCMQNVLEVRTLPKTSMRCLRRQSHHMT